MTERFSRDGPASAKGKNPSKIGKKVTKKASVQEVPQPEPACRLTDEAEDQLQVELYWCIQHLEVCLSSKKLPEKQASDLAKNINVLRSNTAPLIKKRQVMRNTLGNYREKMTTEINKLGKTVSSVKFSDPAAPNKKSVFLKKASDRSSQLEGSSKNLITPILVAENPNGAEAAQNSFKFNFLSKE